MNIIGRFDNIRDTLIANLAKKHLRGRYILDIGCGDGDRTKLLYNMSNKVIGIDMIDNVKKEHKQNFKFILADAKNLPFRKASFDAVVSFDVIEHLDGDTTMVQEAFRVCREGGLFFLGTPNKKRLSNNLYALIGKKIVYPYKLGPNCIHLREYTMEELVRLVEKCRFRVIKKKNIFLGLVGKINLGFNKFPKALEPYVQYLLLIAQK